MHQEGFSRPQQLLASGSLSLLPAQDSHDPNSVLNMVLKLEFEICGKWVC